MPLLSKKPASSQTFPDLGIPKRVNSSGRWYDSVRTDHALTLVLAVGLMACAAAFVDGSSVLVRHRLLVTCLDSSFQLLRLRNEVILNREEPLPVGPDDGLGGRLVRERLHAGVIRELL